MDDSNEDTLFEGTTSIIKVEEVEEEDSKIPEQVETLSSSLLKQLGVLGLKEKMHGKEHENLIPTLIKVAHEYRSIGHFEEAALFYIAHCVLPNLAEVQTPYSSRSL